MGGKTIKSQTLGRTVADNLNNVIESADVEDMLFLTFDFIKKQLLENNPVYINDFVTFDVYNMKYAPGLSKFIITCKTCNKAKKVIKQFNKQND